MAAGACQTPAAPPLEDLVPGVEALEGLLPEALEDLVPGVVLRRFHALEVTSTGWAELDELDFEARWLAIACLRPCRDNHNLARIACAAAFLVAASTAAAPPSLGAGAPDPQPHHVSAATFSARLSQVFARNFRAFLLAAGVTTALTLTISFARSIPKTVRRAGTLPDVEVRAASDSAILRRV